MLIKELAEGVIVGEIKSFTYQKAKKPEQIFLKLEDIKRLTGKKIKKDEIINILSMLEIDVDDSDDDGLKLGIPRYRVDVTRSADVIEEILRIYGYDNIEIPKKFYNNAYEYNPKTNYNFFQSFAKRLVNHGFYEIITNSINSPKHNDLSGDLKPVQIINPMGKELSQLRNSLIPGCLEALKFNINRQSKNLKFFEFGKIYENKNNTFLESKLLAISLTGNLYDENWNIQEHPDNFFYFKGVIEFLLNDKIKNWEESSIESASFSEGLEYKINNKKIVEFGYLNKKLLDFFSIKQPVIYGQFNLNLLSNYAIADLRFKSIPKFPMIKRDFALLIDEKIMFNDIKFLAKTTEKNILKEIKLFDVYVGKGLPKGKKSYGVSFYFQDKNKTLTDHFVDRVMEKLRKCLLNELGAEIR